MALLKLFVCSILVLLSSARTEPRPLSPHEESRINLGTSFQASIEVSREDFEAKMNEASPMHAHNQQPARVSPGGPDPVHHP